SNKQTESEAMRRRALMLPQEISRMPRDQVVVLRPGIMPLRMQRIRWFEDRWFKDRGGAMPEWPLLEVKVERDIV
ncbi:type IV secretory system conjugative DNA transfer family protein, partial [Teichococcus aestuarii]